MKSAKILLVSLLLLIFLWSQGFFVLEATPRGNVAEADSFIVLGFGLGEEIVEGSPEPSASNEAITQRLLELNPPHNRRFAVVQRGVYTALLKTESAETLDAWVIQLPHSKDAYADTHTALYQAWALLEEHQLNKPALITQAVQSERAFWIINNIFPDIIIPSDLPDTFHKNTQFWTSKRWIYASKEYIVSPIGYLLRWY